MQLAAERLDEVAFEMERRRVPTRKVEAFRKAARVAREVGDDELRSLERKGGLQSLPGIGASTASVIVDALHGEASNYLERLVAAHPFPEPTVGADLLAQLKGECHLHTDWSDGGAPLLTMARAARALGHEWMVCTDHTKAAYYAGGLDLERLVAQVALVADVNETLRAEAQAGEAPAFHVFAGCECDILEGGALDHPDEVLEMLDIVVASVHSRLGEDESAMTRRLRAAVENPHVDILGHCTGRLVEGKGRAPSRFDAKEVFAAAAANDTAIEINCRPERLDPPRDLLRAAVELGATFAIDTDAHAPGQLSWQVYGVDRAVECGVTADRVINTGTTAEMLRR